MQGLGDRLRARARELGLSDAEVARRVGLGQTRYAAYVKGRHEPDLGTFVRICAVLGVSPTDLLGGAPVVGDEADALRARTAAALGALDRRSLEVAAIVIDGLAARVVPDHAADADGEPRAEPVTAGSTEPD